MSSGVKGEGRKAKIVRRTRESWRDKINGEEEEDCTQRKHTSEAKHKESEGVEKSIKRNYIFQ